MSTRVGDSTDARQGIAVGAALPWAVWAELGWRGPVLAVAVPVLRRLPILLLLRPLKLACRRPPPRTLEVDGQSNSDAAWYYPPPKDAACEIRGRVAFWKGVEVS